MNWPQPGAPEHGTGSPRDESGERRGVSGELGDEGVLEGAEVEGARSAELVLRGRSAALQAALGSIALRIDALTSATTTFRTMIAERLTDYGEQVNRAQLGAGRDLDDYRRVHERALHDIEAALGESEESVGRLDRSLARVTVRLEEATAALTGLIERGTDRVTRQLADRADAITSTIEAHGDGLRTSVDALEESTAAALAEVAGRLERLAQSAEQQSESLSTLSDDLAQRPVGPGQSPAGLNVDLSPLTDALTRIEALAESLVTGADDQLALAGNIQHIQAVTDALAEASEDRPAIDDVKARLEALQHNVSALVERSAQGEALNAGLSRIEESISGLPRDLGPAEAVQEDLRRLVAQQAEDAGRILDAIQAAAVQTSEPARAAMGAVQGMQRVEAAIERLERAVAEQPAPVVAPETDPAVLEALARIEDAISEQRPVAAETDPAVLDALDRIEDSLAEREPASPDEHQPQREVLEQLAELNNQIEALRRRIALRARPAVALDDATINSMAEALAARVAQLPFEAGGEPGHDWTGNAESDARTHRPT